MNRTFETLSESYTQRSKSFFLNKNALCLPGGCEERVVVYDSTETLTTSGVNLVVTVALFSLPTKRPSVQRLPSQNKNIAI